MPLPKPEQDEKEKDWLSRCMGDAIMVSDYEDTKQRYAICNSIWRKSEMKEKKLETIEIKNIEIAAVGKWDGMANGKPCTIDITAADLVAMVDAFDELTGEEKLNYEPPVKLGHDDKQGLLQEDGYPAAGWVGSLKKVGNKLVASFRDMPKKIAELIKAGAYKKISPEFYTDYNIGGKTYPRVLKAAALLGADIPAIKSTKDIAALYGNEAMLDEAGVPFMILLEEELAEVTLDEIMSDLDTWLEKAEGKIHGKAGSPAIRTYLREVKSKLKALVSKEPKGDEMAKTLAEKVTKREDGVDFPAEAYAYVPDPDKPSEWKLRLWEDLDKKETPSQVGAAMAAFSPGGFRGQKVEIPAEDRDKVKAKIVAAWKRVNPDRDVDEIPKYMLEEKTEQEVIVEKELRELLGLDEKADVLATVKALKEKAEATVVSLAERQATEGKVKELTTKLAERERDERVSKAIHDGKLAPAQKAWADTYALADPTGFEAFIVAAPKVVEFGEKGAEGGKPDEVVLTESEISLGEKMGVSRESLINAKKTERK